MVDKGTGGVAVVRHDDGRRVDVLVVGAGLAGLAAAATAARGAPGARVVLMGSHRPGGRARSEVKDGFVLNQGPHALYRDGAGAAVLAGLGVRYGGAPPARRVFGTVGDRAGLLPTTPASLVRSPLVGAAGKARLGRLLAGARGIGTAALAPISAGEWVRSLRLPADAASVLSTLARVASYAPDLEAVSADAVVRQIQMAAVGNVLYLHGGWQTLVDGLLAAAEGSGVQVRVGEPVAAVEALGPPPGDSSGAASASSGAAPGRASERVAGGNHPQGVHPPAWEVRTARGTWTAGAVVVAAGSPAAAAALVPAAGVEAAGGDATAACLDLGLRRPPEHRVVFALDRPLYLSTHSPGADLAPTGAALVHIMRYGARSAAEDRAELRDFARTAGIGEDDVVVERFLHRMVVHHSLPRPGAGLAGRQTVAVAGLPGLFLAGDWVGPDGLLADAALASGRTAGEAAAATVMAGGAGAGRVVPGAGPAGARSEAAAGGTARPGDAGEAA
jgi:phytoene dehydrogenase-like protein